MKKKTRAPYLLIPAILALVGLFLFSGMKFLEAVLLPKVDAPSQYVSKTIERNGVSYYPRQDITVILLVGTDEEGKIQDSGSYNNKGSADMVALLVMDNKTESCKILCLNRDTMMNIPVLGLRGQNAGSVYAQLATSHNYGSGLSDSCENTRKEVSDYLYGLYIDYYFCMSMDGISVLNDGVGGVEVTIEDDFSAIDETLVKGETILLNGDQAYHFVRSRMNVGTQLNLTRMERQEQYLHGLIAAMRDRLRDEPEFFVDLSTKLSDYMITDCSTTVLNRLVSHYGDYPISEIISLEGENVVGEMYYEFYPDEEKLDTLILELFYSPK